MLGKFKISGKGKKTDNKECQSLDQPMDRTSAAEIEAIRVNRAAKYFELTGHFPTWYLRKSEEEK